LAVLRPREGGLRWGENLWLSLTTVWCYGYGVSWVTHWLAVLEVAFELDVPVLGGDRAQRNFGVCSPVQLVCVNARPDEKTAAAAAADARKQHGRVASAVQVT